MLGIGEIYGGYRIEAMLGTGGVGIVYRVVNEALGRVEALKTLRLPPDDETLSRFESEIRTAAGLEHPQIVATHHSGVLAGRPFVTMQFIEGADASSLVGMGPAADGQVLRIVDEIADALDHAHGRGVIHRDIKPSNILLRRADGAALLADFGIARLIGSPGVTLTGPVVGTMAYVSPEQADGKPVTGASDQYSLACTAYELFSGHPPFRADSGPGMLMQHILVAPPRLDQGRPDLPSSTAAVMARALAKQPEQRYRSCRDFAEALRSSMCRTEESEKPTVVGPRVPETVTGPLPWSEHGGLPPAGRTADGGVPRGDIADLLRTPGWVSQPPPTPNLVEVADFADPVENPVNRSAVKWFAGWGVLALVLVILVLLV